MEILLAFHNGFCPNNGDFSGERERFPSSIGGGVLSNRVKKAGNVSSKGFFS
jgi:hypothetical protein